MSWYRISHVKTASFWSVMIVSLLRFNQRAILFRALRNIRGSLRLVSWEFDTWYSKIFRGCPLFIYQGRRLFAIYQSFYSEQSWLTVHFISTVQGERGGREGDSSRLFHFHLPPLGPCERFAEQAPVYKICFERRWLSTLLSSFLLSYLVHSF